MARKRTSRTSRGRSSGNGIDGIFRAATAAVQELGAAAKDLESSWNHVTRARKHGEPFTGTLERAGKQAVRTTRSVAKKARGIVIRRKR